MDKKQLDYFRALLLETLENTKKEVEKLSELNAEDNRVPDDSDLASLQYEQAFKIRMRERNEKYIKKIKKVISTLDDGSYGVCQECGNDISIERLKARPVATVCIECKKEMEKEEKKSGR